MRKPAAMRLLSLFPSGPLSPGMIILAVLAGLVALPELVLLLADHGLIGSTRWRPLAWQYGGFWAGLLRGWRSNFAAQPATMFVTYAFLHAGPGHMIGNVVTLLTIGGPLLERFGTRGFLAIYAAAILGGGLAFGLLSASPAPMVGASGAIFGLAGAWTWLQATDRAQDGAGPGAVALRVAGIMAGLALLNLVMWLLAGGVLAWETHLGGYLAGLAMAAWCAPAAPPQPAA